MTEKPSNKNSLQFKFQPPQKYTDEQLRKIIDAAEKRLHKEQEKNPTSTKKELNSEEREKLLKKLKAELNPNSDKTTQANQTLLAVLLTNTAGSIANPVKFNWGNLTNVPDINQYRGNAPIDQGNRVSGHDDLGTVAHEIGNIIQTASMNPVMKALLHEMDNASGSNTMSAAEQETETTFFSLGIRPENPLMTDNKEDENGD